MLTSFRVWTCSEMVYCALTGELVAKSEAAIKVHMRGKKFQRAQGAAAALHCWTSAECVLGGGEGCWVIRLALLTIFRS